MTDVRNVSLRFTGSVNRHSDGAVIGARVIAKNGDKTARTDALEAAVRALPNAEGFAHYVAGDSGATVTARMPTTSSIVHIGEESSFPLEVYTNCTDRATVDAMIERFKSKIRETTGVEPSAGIQL